MHIPQTDTEGVRISPKNTQNASEGQAQAKALQYKGPKYNALWQQWYDWLRMSKRRNIEKVSKELAARRRQKRETKLRETSLPCGPKHKKIEALAAAIAVARCSSGMILTRNEVLGGKSIIESLINKLGEETQMSWYLGNLWEEDEGEALSKWLAVEVRAAKIFNHYKLMAAWFKASEDETSKCKTTCTHWYGRARVAGSVHGGSNTHGQQKQLGDKIRT